MLNLWSMLCHHSIQGMTGGGEEINFSLNLEFAVNLGHCRSSYSSWNSLAENFEIFTYDGSGCLGGMS